MPTENFRSREAYRKWTAYRHIHGIAAPHLKKVCIKGKCHAVKHSKGKKGNLMRKNKRHFIQKATARMKKKGTLGSFGRATPKKIAAAKRKGGKMEKKAVFAENMKKIAAKRKRSHKR